MFKFCEKGAAFGALLLRIVTGIIFLVHGAPKLAHLGETIQNFKQMGLPAFVTILVALFEALGGLALILGAFTRIAAVACAIVMVGAIIKVHAQHGFFLNWYLVEGKGHGFEYSLALLAMCMMLFCSGAGRVSVDNIFAKLQETKLKRHSYEERSDGNE